MYSAPNCSNLDGESCTWDNRSAQRTTDLCLLSCPLASLWRVFALKSLRVHQRAFSSAKHPSTRRRQVAPLRQAVALIRRCLSCCSSLLASRSACCVTHLTSVTYFLSFRSQRLLKFLMHHEIRNCYKRKQFAEVFMTLRVVL